MKYYSNKSIIIGNIAGLAAACLTGCGGGGGSTANQSQAQLASFAVTRNNVEAIVGEEFKFSEGIQAVDALSGKTISLPPTTLTVSRSIESPTGYGFKMVLEDGTYVSGNFGFGSCIFTVTKTTAVWEKKNEPAPKILTVGETVEIVNCEVGLNGHYTVTNQEAFDAEIMAMLGNSITDPVRTPVQVITKEDTGTVIINGQNVGDTRLEFVTGATSGG